MAPAALPTRLLRSAAHPYVNIYVRLPADSRCVACLATRLTILQVLFYPIHQSKSMYDSCHVGGWSVQLAGVAFAADHHVAAKPRIAQFVHVVGFGAVRQIRRFIDAGVRGPT